MTRVQEHRLKSWIVFFIANGEQYDSSRDGQMTNPPNLDLRARAQLLSYLVVSHLTARQLTGEWLSPDHVVESTKMWLSTDSEGDDILQRVMLASRAREIAKQIESISPLAHNREQVTSVFRENLRLDFDSPVAQEIYQRCLTELLRTGPS